jgi:hypothetical protein
VFDKVQLFQNLQPLLMFLNQFVAIYSIDFAMTKKILF